jgi:hypothetical protein
MQRLGTLLGIAPKQQEVALTSLKTSLFTKSLIVKSLVRSGIAIASLAVAGNVFAADGHAVKSVKAAPVVHHVVTRRPAAAVRRSRAILPRPVRRRLGGAGYRRQQLRVAALLRYSPTVDASSAANDSLAASEQEDQEIQSTNDTNALNAPMAAAEEQNDAANAATLQTEINAGM